MSPIAGDSAPSPLSPGLYEQVVDRLLERRLAALRRSCIEVTDESSTPATAMPSWPIISDVWSARHSVA